MNCPFCNKKLPKSNHYENENYICKNHPISTKLFACDNVFTDCYLGDEELYIQYYFLNSKAVFYQFYPEFYPEIGPFGDLITIHRQTIPNLTPENATYWIDRIFNLKAFL